MSNILEQIPVSAWVWYGNAGHFIYSSHCRFHLTTRVGDFMVSTVGEYVPDSEVQTILAQSRGKPLTERGDMREAQFLERFGFERLGATGTYETMVFHAPGSCTAKDCGCGMPRPSSFDDLDGERYDSAKEATEGHYKYCFKVARGEITVPANTEA